MALFGFPKSLRIRKRSEFQRVFAHGKRYHTKNFTLVICQTERDTTRLGLVVSKKAGNAVKRNRIKRLLREFFRLNKPIFPASCDVVIIAKPGAHKLNYRLVESELGAVRPLSFRANA